MRIEQIALRNFRSGQNLVLDTAAPRVYICGRNGTGKSSIREAVRWVLRGICSATDAKGNGWQALVPDGTTALSAGLLVNGVGAIERDHRDGKRRLSIEGRDNDITSTQNAIYDGLETTPEFLDAVLETDYFMRLGHSDAKAMVLGLLNVTIPYEGEMLTLAQADSRYNDAFKKRTEAKARARAHSVPVFQMPTEGEPFKTEDIERRITELRAEYDTLVKQSGQSSGRREALEAQLAAAERRSVLPPGPLPSAGELTRLQTALAAWEKEAKAHQAAEEAKPKAGIVKPDHHDFAGLIETLTNHQPTKGCVLDPNVPCDTHKNKFTNRVKFLRSQTEAVAPAPEAEPEPPAAVSTFDALTGSRLQAQIAAHKAAQRSYDDAVKHNRERAEEVDAITAQLKSLPAETTAADQTAAIATLTARIAKGEIVLKTAREFWQAKTAYDKAIDVKVKLDADVDRLEKLCDALGPNGARVAALKSAIYGFEKVISERTAPFGWTVRFELDPWTVHINGRVIEAYSESEQFRIGIAIQMAVASISKLGFMVVDRLDMLDIANRGIVTQMLLEPRPDLEQIIILATREDEQALPTIDGVKAYRLARNEETKDRTVVADSI